MKTKSMIILCVALPMLMAFTVCTNGTKPKNYKDTIYRFPPKKTVPTAVNVPEELRKISINDTIKSFKVKKAERKLYAFFGDTFKVFKISLGANPVGPKIQQGDHKTPEGTYYITFKNPKSRGYKSLKLSPLDGVRSKQLKENSFIFFLMHSYLNVLFLSQHT